MIHVRSLLKRVLLHRPDLTEAKGEAYGLWAIKETVRTVCRDTGLMIEIQDVQPLLANTHTTAMGSTGNEVHKMLKVEVGNLPGAPGASPSTYLGTFDATTGDITPAFGIITKIQTGNAGSFTTNGFYICRTAGTLAVDSITDASIVGDIYLSNGNVWNRFPCDDFYTVEMISKHSMDKWVNANQSNRGRPRFAAQLNETLYWYNPPLCDTAYRFTMSVVPNFVDWNVSTPSHLDMIHVPLPVEAESTVLAGAQEMMSLVPGQLMDANRAKIFRDDFQRGLSGLKAVALLGNHRSWLQPPNVLGREVGSGFWRYRGIQ